MSLRLVVTLLPAVVGWAIGIYLQLRAVQHLRTQRPVIRVTAFLLGPFGGPLYTLEGFRYRGLALVSAYTGLALTVMLLPNKRLKLAVGDRFKGSGVLCPRRARTVVHFTCAGGRVARSLSAIR